MLRSILKSLYLWMLTTFVLSGCEFGFIGHETDDPSGASLDPNNNNSEPITPIGPQNTVFNFNIVSPTEGTAGDCIELNITLLDSLDNQTSAVFKTVLSQSLSGEANLFADSLCEVPLTAIVVTPGSSTATVYVRTELAGDLQLESQEVCDSLVDGGPGARPGNPVNITIAPSVPDSIVLTAQASADIADCVQVIASVEDEFGNPTTVPVTQTINLQKIGTGAFYANAGCTLPITSTQILSGNQNTVFFYRADQAGSETLTATDPAANLSQDSAVIGFGPLNSNIIVVKGPVPIAVNTCTKLEITTHDIVTNLTTVTTNTTVTFSGLTPTAFLYSDENCTQLLANKSVTINQNDSSAVVYYYNSAAESYVLFFDAAGFSTGSWGVYTQ